MAGFSTNKLRASLVAGLVAAVVEMAVVLPVQAAVLGNGPVAVFQSIAYGALGKAAFAGGVGSAALGVGVHLLVSLAAAVVYGVAAMRWTLLLRRPILCGIAYGVICYVVMIFGVIPLSAIGFKPPKLVWLTLVSFSIHLFAFGLPIALVARRMLGPPQRLRTNTVPAE